jgi:hypothetical protein
MRMAHIYQSVMIRALLDYQGEAIRRGREPGQQGTHFWCPMFQVAGAAMALLCLFPAPAHPTNGLSAIGIAYDLTVKVVLRAGYNYGRNPIPTNSLNPLLAAISEHHVTFGGEYAFSPKWQVSTAVEYALNNAVTYHNPELPFGPGVEEENEYVASQLTLSYRW